MVELHENGLVLPENKEKERKGKKHLKLKSKKPLPNANWPSSEHDGNRSLNLGSCLDSLPTPTPQLQQHLHHHHHHCRRRSLLMFGFNVSKATVSVRQCGEGMGDVVVMETEVRGGWCWWWHDCVKGAWPFGRCPVIGWLVGCLSVRWAENWSRREQQWITVGTIKCV